MSRPLLDRRRFLAASAATATVAAIGPGLWSQVLAGPAVPGPGRYGPLAATPDANGLLLPAGFTSRVIARGGVPVPGTTHAWHPFPDGGATFATPDGGWILVSNSENPPPALDLPGVDPALSGFGQVSAVRFAADATVTDAYPVLPLAAGARSNCAGGPTPWGTWLSCEEWEQPASAVTPYAGGKVWECDPTGRRPAVVRPLLGGFKHEMAACDPDRRRIYLSEDQPDGLLYRFTPTRWGDLSAGVLEAARFDDYGGLVAWVPIPDPTGVSRGPTRHQVEATTFDGGEGLAYDRGVLYLSTKGDDRIWAHHIGDGRLEVVYDSTLFPSPVLSGVDNLHVAPFTSDLLVAEDGGNMEICIISPDREVSAFLRATGPEHGVDQPTPLPLESEITGIAFNPDGTRLYFNSQRGGALGISYEVTGPFAGSRLERPAPPSTTSPTTTPTSSSSTATTAGTGINHTSTSGSASPAAAGAPAGGDGRGQPLARTGPAGPPLSLGAAALAAAAAAWWTSRRAATDEQAGGSPDPDGR